MKEVGDSPGDGVKHSSRPNMVYVYIYIEDGIYNVD